MISLLSEQQANNLLKPHAETIRTVMTESLDALNRGMLAFGEKLNNRAKSSTFHSIAIEKATKAFEAVPDVLVIPKYQSIQIVFGQKIVGRIKKVNRDNCPTNAKTKRNDLILRHQLSIFPEHDLTFIELAYRIDTSWAEFQSLAVLCRLNDSIVWKIDLKQSATILNLEIDSEIVKPKEDTGIIKKRKRS